MIDHCVRLTGNIPWLLANTQRLWNTSPKYFWYRVYFFPPIGGFRPFARQFLTPLKSGQIWRENRSIIRGVCLYKYPKHHENCRKWSISALQIHRKNTSCGSVHLSIWVYWTYILHHHNGTGLPCMSVWLHKDTCPSWIQSFEVSFAQSSIMFNFF